MTGKTKSKHRLDNRKREAVFNGPHYADLSISQQALFETLDEPSGCDPATAWKNILSDSQRLEFAGETQAQNTARVAGLSQVAKIETNGIVGSVPGAKSQDQFHINVLWASTAANYFKKIPGWSEHPTWLHKGMYGYQQNENGTPSMGLVVLFYHANEGSGQFHIDFRFWGHFGVDNGNIAANYATYKRWYSTIKGYTHSLPSAGSFHRPIESGRISSAMPQSNLRKTVTGFLNAWYLDRDEDAFTRFIASDNIFAFHKGTILDGSTAAAEWRSIFIGAFATPSIPRSFPTKLTEVIDKYRAPQMAPETKPLKYLNVGRDGRPEDPYAVLDIRSLPPGSFFPNTGAKSERVTTNSYFGHLLTTYGSTDGTETGNLALIVYLIKPDAGLVEEAAITYWIREVNEWKLCAYRGSD